MPKQITIGPSSLPDTGKQTAPSWMDPHLVELKRYAGSGKTLKPLCLGVLPDGKLCVNDAQGRSDYCAPCSGAKATDDPER
jgi:hypothetical protein